MDIKTLHVDARLTTVVEPTIDQPLDCVVQIWNQIFHDAWCISTQFPIHPGQNRSRVSNLVKTETCVTWFKMDQHQDTRLSQWYPNLGEITDENHRTMCDKK
jgi:hypothetical protein